MSFTTALWTANGDQLVPAPRSSLVSEKQLETWIETDPSVLGRDLLIVGRQIQTASGPLDLLGMDEEGELVILELKKGRTPREVVAQVLDYASWVRKLGMDRVDEICLNHSGASLSDAFQRRFSSSLPETACSSHSMIVVASALDDSSERIIEYLQEEHSIDINAVFFNVFEIEGKTVIARSWLADPLQISLVGGNKTSSPWSGFWFVNDGVHNSNGRSWEACVKFGFVSAGGGRNWSDQLSKLKPGDPIFAYEKGRGYVGYGVVTSSSVPASDFRLQDRRTLSSAMDEMNRANGVRDFDARQGDPDLCEYAVGVNWLGRVEAGQPGKWKPGLFAKMHVVCRLRDQATLDFLTKEFNVSQASASTLGVS